MKNPPEASTPVRSVGDRTVALFAFLLALTLAVWGEYAIRASQTPVAGIVLYLAAILLIAATAPRFVLAPHAEGAHTLPRRGWVALAAGALGTLALGIRTFLLLRRDTADDGAFGWWVVSLLPLLLAALWVWRMERPAPLWRSELPVSRAGKMWLYLALLATLLVAVLLRFLWLDAIPFGVNPDEGDRAAVAIQIVRETIPAGIFEVGWYYISMIYFHLMAFVFKAFGIGYVQARAFTALFGVASVAITFWIGLRHFSWRVALLAGILAATTGVVLQFSRLITEAGPTATLWLLSLALMLEGARGGRSLPWVLAGAAGGFSLYFYPTGRVWALLAMLWGGYLLVRWLLAKRPEARAIGRGLAIAAVAALVIAAPYLAWITAHPHELTLRFEQTTVFDPDNASRLGYVDPAWSTPRLVAEQIMRTLGIFNHFEDGGGVWPIRQPILSPALALLALLGIGLVSLRWRDPRFTMLGIVFWVGVSGVIITVETPNLIRMTAAIPLLPLLAALTLEEGITRARAYFASPVARMRALWVATAFAALIVLTISFVEARFYFTDYARMNLWPTANQEGRALTLLPAGTRYTSLGNSFHMVNSGWVRLIAPEADRAGYKHPGSTLPYLGDGAHSDGTHSGGAQDIGVLLYPGQDALLSWLRTLYPEAQEVDYLLPGEPDYFTLLHIPATALAGQGKVQATTPDGSSILVDHFGAQPEGTTVAERMQWSATWRIPQQWNYALRLTGESATLALNGVPFLANSVEQPVQTAAVNLARGDHGIAVAGKSGDVTLEIARMEPGSEPLFAPIPASQLLASDGSPRGFAATIQIADAPEQRRQENTLATCCIGDLLKMDGRSTTATWQATLQVPETGEYGFRLQSPGVATLTIGNEVVIHLPETGAQENRIFLEAAATPITVTLDLPQGGNGALELQWQPPGSAWSILPHTVLHPDAAVLWQPALSDDLLLAPDNFARDLPPETVR